MVCQSRCLWPSKRASGWPFSCRVKLLLVVAGLPAGNPPTQMVLESVLGNIRPMLQGCLLLWSMNLLSCPSVANLIEVPGANPTSQQPQHPLSLSVAAAQSTHRAHFSSSTQLRRLPAASCGNGSIQSSNQTRCSGTTGTSSRPRASGPDTTERRARQAAADLRLARVRKLTEAYGNLRKLTEAYGNLQRFFLLCEQSVMPRCAASQDTMPRARRGTVRAEWVGVAVRDATSWQ